MIRRILNKIESIYKYRYLANNNAGAYNFLLQNVFKGTDVDFIEKVFQLDYFREVLVPEKINLYEFKKVLILAPHQDDEVIGCGGVLLRLKELKANVQVVFLTDGKELSNPEKSVEIRQKEAKKVCDSLNARMEYLNVDNVTLNIEQNHLKKLVNFLDSEWDAVFTVWPLDNPPKHRLCSYLVGKAIQKVKNRNYPIYFYTVHTDLLPNFYEDITEVINDKEKLIKLYASQLDVQRYDHLSRGLDAWRTRFLPVSSELRYVETFCKIPSKAYLDFQKVFENGNSERLFKKHEACISSFYKIKKFK